MSANSDVGELRRYCFGVDRFVQTTECAEITVTARSEDEAWNKAQAQLHGGYVDWNECNTEEDEPDLSLESTEDPSEEEVEEFLEERREEEEAARAAEQRAARGRDIHSILAALRKTASEEERADLIDALEQML
jgi:non-homologous end joining protein Ku